jgi:hypothetical protein
MTSKWKSEGEFGHLGLGPAHLQLDVVFLDLLAERRQLAAGVLDLGEVAVVDGSRGARTQNALTTGINTLRGESSTPAITFANSGGPFNSRRRFAADSISLNTTVRQPDREPLPFVLFVRSRTVESF